MDSFGLYRQQCDLLWSLGEVGLDGVFRIPARHCDAGWCDYREPKAIHGFDRNAVLLYHCTQLEEDRQRLMRLPGATEGFTLSSEEMGKGGTFPATAWHTYVTGGNAGYPVDVLEATLRECDLRLAQLEQDDGSVSHVTQWASLSPVVPHGLLQLICGTPGLVYHGGLIHARLMPFDPVAQRPGLPAGVAMLVHAVRPDGVSCTIVNTDAAAEHTLIIQAGAFGEHSFTNARINDGQLLAVNDKHLQLRLAAAAQAEVMLGMELNSSADPSYARPWDDFGGSSHPQSNVGDAGGARM